MDLENFPLSEIGKRMLDSVSSGFYDNSYVGKWIFQVMGLEMEDARKLIEELPYQAFPETATWGLRYHEQKYGLPIRWWLTYDERRRFIYQKRDEHVPMNPYRMELIAKNIAGEETYIEEYCKQNRFVLYICSDNLSENKVLIRELVEKRINAVKQSHVCFSIRYYTETHRGKAYVATMSKENVRLTSYVEKKNDKIYCTGRMCLGIPGFMRVRIVGKVEI